MGDDRRRALRRHHKFRMRIRARRILYRLLWWPWESEGMHRMIVRRADNLAICSDRRYWKALTLQEDIDLVRAREYLEDLPHPLVPRVKL
jgi:hypothetical protein